MPKNRLPCGCNCGNISGEWGNIIIQIGRGTTDMVDNEDFVRQEVNRGVKAHKGGNDKAAWLHFQSALREDPDNVTSLLWLAYLSDDYEKCVFLLDRVLEIDADNERAKAGLAWARKELAREQGEGGPATAEDVANLSQRLKRAVGVSELKHQAQKGTIAQRARRRISP